MGTIYRPSYTDRHGAKRTSAVWWVKYSVNGQPVSESTQTRDYTDAKEYLKRREGEAANGVPVMKGQRAMRFRQLAADVVNDYRVNGRRSLRDIETRFTLHILPVFGEQKASAIDTAALRAYIDRRQAEGAANGTINRELTAIKRAFNLAAQVGRVAHTPYVPMLKETNTRTGFFDLEQFLAVRRHLPAPLQPVVTFAYITGWRRSEVFSLEWPQVDFENRCVRLYTSKNDEGRVFPYTDDLEALLLEQRAKADELQRQGTITPWVFNHRGGQRIVEYKRSWRTACRRAGPRVPRLSALGCA